MKLGADTIERLTDQMATRILLLWEAGATEVQITEIVGNAVLRVGEKITERLGERERDRRSKFWMDP